MRLVPVLLLLGSTPALAGDQSTFDVEGFTKGGRHVIVVESWVGDGSGISEAHVRAVDVAKNDFTGKDLVVAPKKEGDDARPLALEKAKALRLKLGGLAAAPFAKLERVDADTFKDATGRTFAVKLTQKELVTTGALKQLCNEGDAKASFTLPGFRLEVTPQGGAPIVMQDDRSVPKSRGCTLGYTVRDAWLAAPNALLVEVRLTRRGFEGPDARSLPVTVDLSKKRK